jgi:hypothetical protein
MRIQQDLGKVEELLEQPGEITVWATIRLLLKNGRVLVEVESEQGVSRRGPQEDPETVRPGTGGGAMKLPKIEKSRHEKLDMIGRSYCDCGGVNRLEEDQRERARRCLQCLR